MDCSLSNLVSSLVSCGRPVWRLVFSIRSSYCLSVLFLFVSCGRFALHLVPSSRPVSSCLLVSFFLLRSLGRLVLSTCRSAIVSSCCLAGGILLARLVFLFICLIVLMVCDEMFLRGRRAAVSSRWACGSFPCRLDLLATKPLCGVRAHHASSCHEAEMTARHGGERRDELNKTARQQDGRQACGILASDKTETG